MKNLIDEIAELRALPVSELVARYELAFGKPPRVKHKEFLWKRIAWKLQEQRLGGLSAVAQSRLEDLIAQIDIPTAERQRDLVGRRVTKRKPAPQAALVKTWRGRQYTATPVAGGFECEGVVHRSLSAAAQAITGTKWNGRLFWGLVPRGGQ